MIATTRRLSVLQGRNIRHFRSTLWNDRLTPAAVLFARNERGNVALLFGLMSMLLFTTMGGGLDFSRAYLARQKLSQIATMACQYANRNSIVQTAAPSYNGSNGAATYVNNVNNFISTTWQTQKVNLTQSNVAPFTYTPGGAANVNLTATMPTTFISIVGINSIPLTAQSHCYDTIASVTQRVPDSNGQFLIKEGFEATPNGPVSYWTPYQPNGQSYLSPTPSSTYSSAVAYTGTGGTQWHVIGYCLEQDRAGTNIPTVQEGNYTIELDCDSGQNGGLKGNSSITTQQYMAAGQYELRYFYSGRVHYPTYDPTYLCGSSANDLSWANDTNSVNGYVGNALRTNQINVYLDLNDPSTNAPPLHTTLDGQMQLAGGNLIDMCVYSADWIERSVDITVTTPGYYWLSFAADGTSDSAGGQLDNIRLCRVSCSLTVQDNFPVTWTAGKTLFEDTFEAMTVKANYGLYGDGDISTSYGTSGTAASGWSASATAWRISQVNEISLSYYQPVQGAVSIEPDADAYRGGVANPNRTISRSFLLDPGYYQVSYYYRSNITFASLGSNVMCGATPSAARLSSLTGTGTGNQAYSGGGNGTWNYDTNMIGVFMSHDAMASNPNYAAFNSVATYNNPNGTTTSTPTTPDDNISLTNYNASQVNPLLDICGYAGTWQTRTATIKILKPAYYWLTIAALGTADNSGGAIDDVKLASLGSAYMTSPPAGAVTIPAPDPQPSSNIYFTGFSISADQFAP